MISFVIFAVLDRSYGISIDKVKRILPSPELTEVPESGDQIEGMFQYEDKVLNVLGFRKAIGELGYEDQLNKMFLGFKEEYSAWMKSVEECVVSDKPFSKNCNAHKSKLGGWMDGFHPDNSKVLSVMNQLTIDNQGLFLHSNELLKDEKNTLEQKQEIFNTKVKPLYEKIIVAIDTLIGLSAKVASELQRCLIIEESEGKTFGLNIDSVEGIVHIQDDDLHAVQEDQSLGDFMDVAGILKQEDKLITIIKDISLTKRSA